VNVPKKIRKYVRSKILRKKTKKKPITEQERQDSYQKMLVDITKPFATSGRKKRLKRYY